MTENVTGKKKKGKGWLWAVSALVVILLCGGTCGGGMILTTILAGEDLGTGPAVGIVPVTGVIVSGEPASSLGENDVAYSGRIINYLRQAQGDPSIKAIVLRINSPGGSVVASNEIYEELKKIDKPVVVSMGELAASGGYYISCMADKIVVNPGTLTGSIGVIAQVVNVEELIENIGMEVTTIKSGPHKDEGSLFREMTEEEKEIWQKIIDESYDLFVEIVAEGRGLSEKEVRKLADGRVYTGQQAVELGLADQLGNLQEAIDLAAELGEIEGKPRLIEYRPPPTLLDTLLGALSRPAVPTLDEFLGQARYPTLQYLYLAP
jgi:protease-4